MLTRQAPNFAEQFPDGLFAIYSSVEECLEKISHYLDRPAERNAIAQQAEAFVAENYHYRDIVTSFSHDLEHHLARKFGT